MYLFYYFIIPLSIVGYGYLLTIILNIESKNFGKLGLLGISFLVFISYSTAIFFKHGYFFNLIILILGLMCFFYLIIKKKFFKSELIIFFSVFSLLLIFILVGKNHDDFSYYHFPYSMIISEFSHPLGLGVINNGFRNPSSIFFLSSLFYLPKIEYYLFHISSAYFLGFSNIIFIKNIFNKNIFNKNKFINYLSLISFLFINIFFYRLAEYGTDRSPQILIIIVILLVLIITNYNYTNKRNIINDVFLVFILLSLSASIKPIYLLYSPLVLILLFSKNIKELFKDIIISKTFIYCLFFNILFLFYNLINSGCLVFPAVFTCFANLPWTLEIHYIESVNLWYELWSKAGASPNFEISDKLNYVSQFNWLQRWVDIYFFNKVSDFLLGLIVLSLVVLLFYYKKNNNIINNNYLLVYLFIFFALLEWFFKHPTLRYGGYHLIALMIFIPLSVYLSKKNIQFDEYKKKAIILILIGITIFYARNIKRLFKEYKNYKYYPLKSLNYVFTQPKEFYFRYNSIIKNKYDTYDKIKLFGKNIVIIKAKK